MPLHGPTEAHPSPTLPLEYSLSPLSLFMITTPLATLDPIKLIIEVDHHGGCDARFIYLDTGVLCLALQDMKSFSESYIILYLKIFYILYF